MVGSASGPGSTFKAFLGSARVRVPLSNKIWVRVGSVQHIYGSLRVRVRILDFYLGVNISEDITWTTHIQTQVKKARQRLYHLRQLRKFRVSPAILKTFYSGAIESVLTQCISVWYNNATNQDCKALQRVVRLAERISGFALPSLQDIYLKRCKSRAFV